MSSGSNVSLQTVSWSLIQMLRQLANLSKHSITRNTNLNCGLQGPTCPPTGLTGDPLLGLFFAEDWGGQDRQLKPK